MTHQTKIKYLAILFIVGAFASMFYLKMNAPKVYEGVAEGFDGEIKVRVTAYKNGKKELRITDIQVEHNDTEAIAGPAIETLISNIKSTQNIEIEGVAGASYSSQGFLEAVRDAVSKMEEK